MVVVYKYQVMWCVQLSLQRQRACPSRFTNMQLLYLEPSLPLILSSPPTYLLSGMRAVASARFLCLTDRHTSVLFQPKLSVRADVEALCWSTSSRLAKSLCSSSGITLTCRKVDKNCSDGHVDGFYASGRNTRSSADTYFGPWLVFIFQVS